MNITNNILLNRIKETVLAIEPTAEIILYGSYARGDNREDSDIDVLVLVNNDMLSYQDKKKISYPLYELETEIGIIISPVIYDKQLWKNKHYITPFYKSIQSDGILL
jgi:uncharacterized protein